MGKFEGDMMQYESPIEVYTKKCSHTIENDIVKAVVDLGINVDRAELIKALQYDRQQYQQGYRDGYNAALMIAQYDRIS